METGSFRVLRPVDIPRALALMIRVIPYLVSFSTICLALAFVYEANEPRGTFAYITRQGWSAQFLAWLAASCGLLGIVFWHYARRNLFWGCVLCVIICFPMTIYSFFGTRYLTTEVQGSYATLVMFWTCCVVCILFVGFLILLAAWIEVSKFAERHRG